MKSSFDQQLKQQLEQSRPEDLGYKPDRDKLWGRIEAKQKRKTLPLRLWISHAAAIAAGLIIGSYFLTTYNRSERTGTVKQMGLVTSSILLKQVSDTAPAVAATPQPGDKTTTSPAQRQAPGLQQNRIATRRQQSTTSVALQPATQKIITTTGQAPQVNEPVPVPAPEQATVIAHTGKPKAKVLHLMDIDNENTRMMHQPPEHNMTWAWMLPTNQVTSNQASFSEQIGQHLFHIKN